MNRLAFQVRISAVSGWWSALPILLVTVAVLTVRIIISRFFGSGPAFDVKVTLVVGSSIVLIWYVGVFASTFIDLRRELAHGRQARQSFTATAFVAGLYGLVILLSGSTAIGMYREGDPAWMLVLPLSFAVMIFLVWPRTIHIDETGVWQRSRFGRTTRINYADVIALSDADDTITVTGSTGTIEHSQCHEAASRFAQLISKRSGKPVY